MAALLKENKTQADIAARRATLLEEGIAAGDIADWGQRTKLRHPRPRRQLPHLRVSGVTLLTKTDATPAYHPRIPNH